MSSPAMSLSAIMCAAYRGCDYGYVWLRMMCVCVQSDVSKRKDDSTVASKIQTFIPGNLIVVSLVESTVKSMMLMSAVCIPVRLIPCSALWTKRQATLWRTEHHRINLRRHA